MGVDSNLRQRLRVGLVCCAAIGAAFALSSRTGRAGDARELDRPDLIPASSDCTLQLDAVRTPKQVWHEISSRAELVSRSLPTEPNAGGSSHHRAAAPPASQGKGFIDDEIFGKMKRDSIVPTTQSSDAEFLRRVTIDLTGQAPDPDTVTAFLADKSPDKRDRMINQLLASDSFNDRWTMWFGDLVQNVQASTSSREYYVGRNQYYNWIRTSIHDGKPYDQMVRELISGKGDSFVDGPPNFWVRQIQPNGPIQDTYDNLSAESGAKFLAMPFQCLSCHNGFGHLEMVNTYMAKRSRMDFWKNAAFFAQTGAATMVDPATNFRKTIVSDNTTGAYRLNTTSGNKTPRVAPDPQSTVVAPAFFLTGEKPRPGESRREAYGRILIAHPQFARAAVNYLWKELFGMGLVEPVDSMDLSRLDPTQLAPGATAQPTHPQLLFRLADDFAASGYDLRALLRLMVSSNAYQLSSRYTPGTWSEAWTPYYARHYPRRIMAETLLDSVFRATSVGANLNASGMGTVTRALQLPDTTELGASAPYGRFLNGFGRGDRDNVQRTDDSSITQALTLMNDSLVTTRVKQATSGSTVQKVLKSTTDPAAVADAIYLATLSRHPTAPESAAAVTYLKSGDRARKTEDLQFSLLNKLEFMFN